MINPTDFGITGLTNQQVDASKEKHGVNSFNYKKENSFFNALKSIAKEPMIILLLIVSSIYFVTGNYGDGVFLASAIVLVGSISLYQDSRSRKALENLENLTHPKSKVIRNGAVVEIDSQDIVVGDFLMVEECLVAYNCLHLLLLKFGGYIL